MVLYPKTTGVLKSGDVTCTKSIASLLICTVGGYENLSNESITIWIERVNRPNVYLATTVNLAKFIALTNFGLDSIQSNAEYKMIAICELSGSGNVQLNEGEVLKFKIEGLKSVESYTVYGLEEPETGYDFYTFDRKTIASDDLQKTLNIENSELVIFNTNTVSEITVEYGNGAKTRYLPFELQTVARDVDPIFIIGADGLIKQGVEGQVLMPSIGVLSLEINKVAGSVIELTTRVSKNLLEV